MLRLRLRTTLTLSVLAVAGGIGMAWWMSAWPRLQDQPIEAAVAARRREPLRPPVRAPARHRRQVIAAAIQPARAAPPVVPAAPAPAVAPAPVYAPSPAYPIEALRRQFEGVVILRVSVDGAGDVTAVSVAHASGDPALDASAQQAVRRWRFQAPAGHQPMTFDYPVAFRIGNTPP